MPHKPRSCSRHAGYFSGLRMRASSHMRHRHMRIDKCVHAHGPVGSSTFVCIHLHHRNLTPADNEHRTTDPKQFELVASQVVGHGPPRSPQAASTRQTARGRHAHSSCARPRRVVGALLISTGIPTAPPPAHVCSPARVRSPPAWQAENMAIRGARKRLPPAQHLHKPTATVTAPSYAGDLRPGALLPKPRSRRRRSYGAMQRRRAIASTPAAAKDSPRNG